MKIIIWILRIVVAVILLQTLLFRLSGAEESIYIFSTLGIEPYGRTGSGIAELIVVVLILFPRTTWLGALGGSGIMVVCVQSHVWS